MIAALKQRHFFGSSRLLLNFAPQGFFCISLPQGFFSNFTSRLLLHFELFNFPIMLPIFQYYTLYWSLGRYRFSRFMIFGWNHSFVRGKRWVFDVSEFTEKFHIYYKKIMQKNSRQYIIKKMWKEKLRTWHIIKILKSLNWVPPKLCPINFWIPTNSYVPPKLKTAFSQSNLFLVFNPFKPTVFWCFQEV